MTYRADFLLDPPSEPTFFVPPTVAGEVWVYMHLGEANECLYVGKTKAPENRTATHRVSSKWFAQVADFVWFGPMSEIHAAACERELIAAIDPPNNIRHTSRDPRVLSVAERVKYGEARVLRLSADLASAERTLAKARAQLEIESAEASS